MSGSVSYSSVRNCHRTFVIPQNSQVAFWYEEGISKLVSRYDKCLIVQGDYVEKQVKVCDKTCIFCFFLIINNFVWQNVLYFPNDFRTLAVLSAMTYRNQKYLSVTLSVYLLCRSRPTPARIYLALGIIYSANIPSTIFEASFCSVLFRHIMHVDACNVSADRG